MMLQNNGQQAEKKKRIEIQKYEYLENEKSFLDEIKSISHSFWRTIIWWKNKNLMKIVDTSFKQHEAVEYIGCQLDSKLSGEAKAQMS